MVMPVQLWAVLSASFAALTAMFAKVGRTPSHPDFATFIRTIVILLSKAQWQLLSSIAGRRYLFLISSGLPPGRHGCVASEH
jgi:transporter family protein